MEIQIIEEAGHTAAVTGMKFSFQPECELTKIEEAKYADTKNTRALAKLDGGHNKFLESIVVWFDMRAPFYFWKQFDTYRIGVTKQSKSTMHCVMDRALVPEDFESTLYDGTLDYLNTDILDGNFTSVIRNLPDSYMQTRRVCLSYKVIRHIIKQRQGHRLPGWEYFCTYMKDNLKYPRLLGGV